MDNLVDALYGEFSKSIVNGRIVWDIPCDPVSSPATVPWLPREAGEGLLCYMIRLFNDIFPLAVTTDGVQTLTNKTLTAPVINGATGILASDIEAGTFDAGVVLPIGQTTGTLANNRTTATDANTASAIVSRNSSGGFSATSISSNLIGNVTGNITGNLSGNVTGSVTGNVTGNLTGNAATATAATTAAACSGNSATATTAAACSGNSATASAAFSGSVLASLLPKAFANISATAVVTGNVGTTITATQSNGVFAITNTSLSTTSKVLITQLAPITGSHAPAVTLGSGSCTVYTFSHQTASSEPFSILIL